MEAKDKIRILSGHLEETDITVINQAIEEAYKAGKREVSEAICCLVGNLMLKDIEQGRILGEQLRPIMEGDKVICKTAWDLLSPVIQEGLKSKRNKAGWKVKVKDGS